ncbi:ABC transporter substrate-binding protein [Klebsiella sp. BIGb0407]|uniref:ABC transporter substrate-binding protein n=1 Tax=Klebsiella sp. BIGb0407 TaxID=2940603 RepID=UPI0038F81D5B|nr:osmoprotectant transport system substrate-binding protein [Klebsiella sp. BIGb0407]
MTIKNGLFTKYQGLRMTLLALSLAGASFAAQAETVTIGGANYSEQTVLANIYASALRQQGIDVKTRLNLGNREIIIPALQSGELDVVPEYIGALLNYYHGGSESTTQKQVTDELVGALPEDLVLLETSPGGSITAWAVREETAKKYNLKTLSDLAKVAPELVVGGPPEVAVRALGLPGLERVYGIKFKAFKSLDIGGPLSRLALNSGKIDVATIVSTQGDLVKEKWVVLEDDKNEQPAQNVVPLIHKGAISPKSEQILNNISAKITTQDIINLNKEVDVDRKDPAKVADQWVKEKLAAK